MKSTSLTKSQHKRSHIKEKKRQKLQFTNKKINSSQQPYTTSLIKRSYHSILSTSLTSQYSSHIQHSSQFPINHHPSFFSTSSSSSSSLPSFTNYEDPIKAINACQSITELSSWFHIMGREKNIKSINLGYKYLQQGQGHHFLDVIKPPVIFTSVIDCNLHTNNSTVSQVLLDSIHAHIQLPPSFVVSTVRTLANSGCSNFLDSIYQSLSKNNLSNDKNISLSSSSSSDPINPQINKELTPLYDDSTLTQIKESLILSYITNNRFHDAQQTLFSIFHPGSGSIPSDYLIDTLTFQLLKQNRPRQAFTIIEQFQSAINPRSLSRISSRIALSLLKLNLIPSLNTVIAFMEKNDISPHASMVNSLLNHIVHNIHPLTSLRWYNQIYTKNRQELFLQSAINPALSEQSNNNNNELSSDLNNSSISSTTSITNDTNTAPTNGFNLQAANNIIKSLIKNNYTNEALEFVSTLPVHRTTVNILLQGFLAQKDFDSLRLTFKYMSLRGLPLDEDGLHVYIDSLVYHSQPVALLSLLNNLLDKKKTISLTTWSHFLRAFKLQKSPQLCEQTLQRMIQSGLQPVISSFTLVMQAYLANRQISEAMRIKQTMENLGMKPDLVMYSALLDELLVAEESLMLYNVLTEIFNKADEVLTDTNDFNQIGNIFGLSFDTHAKLQNLQSSQRLLIYLRHYLKSACYLLSQHGYARHSNNLALFYHENAQNFPKNDLSVDFDSLNNRPNRDEYIESLTLAKKRSKNDDFTTLSFQNPKIQPINSKNNNNQVNVDVTEEMVSSISSSSSSSSNVNDISNNHNMNKMFNTDQLESLPALSLNDYIDYNQSIRLTDVTIESDVYDDILEARRHQNELLSAAQKNDRNDIFGVDEMFDKQKTQSISKNNGKWKKNSINQTKNNGSNSNKQGQNKNKKNNYNNNTNNNSSFKKN